LRQWLDGEAEVAEHPDSVGLAALKVTGHEALPGDDLVGGAENGLVR
jgi:hypothetical protein